jgi:hypothetical protein
MSTGSCHGSAYNMRINAVQITWRESGLAMHKSFYISESSTRECVHVSDASHR